MSDIPQAVPVEGPDGTIQQHMACRRCGYNLRGLTLDMACPECSTPVGDSVHGDLLAFADPDWLDRLRLGTTINLWLTALIALASLGGFLAALLGAVNYMNSIAVTLFGLLCSGLSLWASFLITTQEPRISLEEDTVTLRKVVRGCALIGFFGGALQEAAAQLQTSQAMILAFVLEAALVPVWIVAYFGEFLYYRRFARRIPDQRLARSTTIVMWGLATGAGLMGGAALTVALVGGGGTGGAGAAIVGTATLGCAAAVALLVFGLWYVNLLLRYKRAFSDAAASARTVAAGFAAGEAPSEPPSAAPRSSGDGLPSGPQSG